MSYIGHSLTKQSYFEKVLNRCTKHFSRDPDALILAHFNFFTNLPLCSTVHIRISLKQEFKFPKNMLCSELLNNINLRSKCLLIGIKFVHNKIKTKKYKYMYNIFNVYHTITLYTCSSPEKKSSFLKYRSHNRCLLNFGFRHMK